MKSPVARFPEAETKDPTWASQLDSLELGRDTVLVHEVESDWDTQSVLVLPSCVCPSIRLSVSFSMYVEKLNK